VHRLRGAVRGAGLGRQPPRGVGGPAAGKRPGTHSGAITFGRTAYGSGPANLSQLPTSNPVLGSRVQFQSNSVAVDPARLTVASTQYLPSGPMFQRKVPSGGW
jgi:hypothetical protein